MLVGNKSDKINEREVSQEEGYRLAQHFGCDFMETSAKTSQNVDNLFTQLVRSLRATKTEAPPVGLSETKGESRRKKKGKINCIIL